MFVELCIVIVSIHCIVMLVKIRKKMLCYNYSL